MATFIFNKLVRDKLPKLYDELQQKIMFQKLTGTELLLALRQKLAEEASEVPIENGSRKDIVDELSDVQQVMDDMRSLLAISDDEIATAQKRKFDKKGGFSDGIFIETIELSDDDEWNEYYRREPDKYREVA